MMKNRIIDSVSFDDVNYMVDGWILMDGIEKQNTIEKRILYCQRVILECQRNKEKYNKYIEKEDNITNKTGFYLKICENEERINVASHYIKNVRH